MTRIIKQMLSLVVLNLIMVVLTITYGNISDAALIKKYTAQNQAIMKTDVDLDWLDDFVAEIRKEPEFYKPEKIRNFVAALTNNAVAMNVKDGAARITTDRTKNSAYQFTSTAIPFNHHKLYV